MYQKLLSRFRRTCNKNNWLWKKRDDIINKLRRKKNISISYVIYAKKFSVNDKKYQKVTNLCYYTGKYRGAAHDIWNLRYKIPKEIPSICIIIKKLAKECEGQLECLGENRKISNLFSTKIKKEVDNGKTITYKIRFIASFRSMSSSLSSSLVDNLPEGLHNYNCTNRKFCLDYISTKNNQLIFKYI